MIIRSSIILLIAMVIVVHASAQTPQYFITAPGSSGIGSPFHNDTNYNKSQLIYHPSEFAGAPPGMIVAVYVKPAYIEPFRNGTPSYSNFTIRMKQYQPDTFPNTRPFPFVTGMTTVLQAPTYTFSGPVTVDKWIKIPLQTPFPFSREINLLVEISQGPDTPKNGFGLKSYGSPIAHRRLSDKVNAATTMYIHLSLPYFGFDLAPTSVGATGGLSDVSIYPNPGSGRFRICFEAKASVREVSVSVRNALGQEVYRQAYRDIGSSFAADLDMEGAAKGVYVVEVSADGATAVKRLAIQ